MVLSLHLYSKTQASTSRRWLLRGKKVPADVPPYALKRDFCRLMIWRAGPCS
jgi:hypothetical protein